MPETLLVAGAGPCLGAAVRPPETDFPGAVGADEVAERYLDLANEPAPRRTCSSSPDTDGCNGYG